MIYADDYYNLTEDMEKKRKFNEKVGDLFREDNLMLNDDKKRIKYSKYLTIQRIVKITTLEEITKRQGKVSTEKRVKKCTTLRFEYMETINE